MILGRAKRERGLGQEGKPGRRIILQDDDTAIMGEQIESYLGKKWTSSYSMTSQYFAIGRD